MKNVLFTAVAAVTITLAGAPVSAQSQSQKDAGPDPAHVRELIKQAQQQLQPVEQPAGQRKPFVTPGPRVDLSLQDAVQRAADKNIDIAVARITPRLTGLHDRQPRRELPAEPDVNAETTRGPSTSRA